MPIRYKMTRTGNFFPTNYLFFLEEKRLCFEMVCCTDSGLQQFAERKAMSECEGDKTYCANVVRLHMGRKIASAKKRTITPTPTVSTGSIIPVRFLTAYSTSVS